MENNCILSETSESWRGIKPAMTVTDSLINKGFAFRLKDKAQRIHECYLPHPDAEGCCFHISEVSAERLFDLLIRKNYIDDFRCCMNMSLAKMKRILSLEEILENLCQFYNILDILDMSECNPAPIFVQDVIMKITENKDYETTQEPYAVETSEESEILNNEEEDNFIDEFFLSAPVERRAKKKVVISSKPTLFDKFVKSRNLTDLPDYPWQFKITDEEYQQLKEYIGTALLNKYRKEEYDREVALYFGEFHRREFDYKERSDEDSGPITTAYDALHFDDESILGYETRKRKFIEAAKRGAEKINAEIYVGNGKTWYIYSLLYNGGLPLKKCLNVENNQTWRRLIKRIMSSDEKIEFGDELQDLVTTVTANNIEALKAFCAQLQEALLLEDYHELPFYCSSENDPYYQFFLTQGRDVVTELKSRNPFHIQWLFDLNMHRKVIMPKFHVSGPDSISFNADFINKSSELEGKDHFTVVVCADGIELDSVIYNRTTKDFYGNRELSVEYAYKEAANISVRCLEIDKTFESEDLDILSPQLIRQGENCSFITSSNRFIGHRETFIIIPKGWHVHDTGKYPVEDGYIYLDTNASLLRLPAGYDYEPIILIDDKGNYKVFSQYVSLNKLVVLRPSMCDHVKQNVYFNVENLPFFIKKADGSLASIRNRNLLFCNDRRTGIWTTEAPLGYIYVKPADSKINADPIRILNLGKSISDFSINYQQSNPEICPIDVHWSNGRVESQNAQKHVNFNERWIVRKEQCTDSRYVDFLFNPSDNSGKPFNLTIKTHFRDFSIFDIEGNMPKDGSYLSFVQLPTYSYHLQDVNVSIDLNILLQEDKSLRYLYEIKGTKARNGRIPVKIIDCKDRQERDAYVLSDSSFDNLFGGMELMSKYLYSSPKVLRNAEIEVKIKWNGYAVKYHIRKYPYRFIKEGYDRIFIKDINENIIDFDGSIRALPLYNYEGIEPVSIEKDEEGVFILPENVVSWNDVLLVSGHTEWVLSHMVDTTVVGEVSKEALQDRILTVYEPMLYNEYPHAKIWGETWRRCLYWYDKAQKEHISSDSLFDLKCVSSNSQMLVNFALNLFIKDLLEGNFEENKKKLKQKLEAFSHENAFLWVWTKKEDCYLSSLMPFLEFDVDEDGNVSMYKAKELLIQWYSYKQQIDQMIAVCTKTEIGILEIQQFITDLIVDFNDFMFELREESLQLFIDGNRDNVTAKDILNNKESKLYDIEEEIYRRLEDWQKLPLLNEESEIKHFGGILGKNYGRPNFNHFMERAMMMIKHMKGELDIFEKWPYVRRNVLYYTSYYKDKFVRLMLNETEIH